MYLVDNGRIFFNFSKFGSKAFKTRKTSHIVLCFFYSLFLFSLSFFCSFKSHVYRGMKKEDQSVYPPCGMPFVWTTETALFKRYKYEYHQQVFDIVNINLQVEDSLIFEGCKRVLTRRKKCPPPTDFRQARFNYCWAWTKRDLLQNCLSLVGRVGLNIIMEPLHRMFLALNFRPLFPQLN